MASFNGKNYALSQVEPKKKMNPGQQYGQVHVLREELDIAQAYANGDEVLGPYLPAGARVINAFVKVNATLGATGILDLGHKGSEDGSIVEDQDAFIVSADAGGQAVLKNPTVANVGMDTLYAEKVQTYLKFTELSVATAGVKISYSIEYTLN